MDSGHIDDGMSRDLEKWFMCTCSTEARSVSLSGITRKNDSLGPCGMLYAACQSNELDNLTS